jgi:hypothetical protein
MAHTHKSFLAQEGDEKIEAAFEADNSSYNKDLEAQEQAAQPRSKYFARQVVVDFGTLAFGDGTVRVAKSSRAFFYLVLLLAIVIPPLLTGVGKKLSPCTNVSRSRLT